MSNPIETKPETEVSTTNTSDTKTGDPGCCTIPPDGDPGPVKG
jgi:hypothetical protein